MRFGKQHQLGAILAVGFVFNSTLLPAQQNATNPAGNGADRPQLTVKATQDFELTGDGIAVAWKSTEWTDLNKRVGASHAYTTQFKTLYSDTGIYFLLDGTDSRLTATMENDFDDLYNEDVFEVFLWTDESIPIYFEYEISPFNKELPILVPNFGGKFYGWRPWHYEGQRKTRTSVRIKGGTAESGAPIEGWTAEVFIPYSLLNPLQNIPPKSGTKWRANVYRIDYDRKMMTQWDWARVGPSFHDFRNYGTFVFE
jgi:hypothetical protein